MQLVRNATFDEAQIGWPADVGSGDLVCKDLGFVEPVGVARPEETRLHIAESQHTANPSQHVTTLCAESPHAATPSAESLHTDSPRAESLHTNSPRFHTPPAAVTGENADTDGTITTQTPHPDGQEARQGGAGQFERVVIRRMHSDADDAQVAVDEPEEHVPTAAVGEPEQHSCPYQLRSHTRPKALAATVSMTVPASYEEAIRSPNSHEWAQAMNEEMASLSANDTWSLESLPLGYKAIPCKWVFALKQHSDGSIDRYKARLVAKGFKQRHGIDFDEVYAPVSKHATLRALLALVANKDMECQQLDIKTAFLNGYLEETLYMQQPPGYHSGAPNTVCHLHKSLYGLRQASRAWHTRLKEELNKHGFTPSQADAGLFVLHECTPVYILAYVDDLLIASESHASVNRVKTQIMSSFKARDLGEASYFLGMDIVRDRKKRTLILGQRKYARDVLSRFGMLDAKSNSLPAPANFRIQADGDPCDPTYLDYPAVVGCLQYLATCTRPDLCFLVSVLARYVSRPTADHCAFAKGVLAYLAGTTNLGIAFGTNKDLVGFSDSDYAANVDNRRSTTGYVFLLHGGAISWSSRLQPTVAASTCEAEYMAAASTVKEALWLKILLNDLGCRSGAVQLYADNQGTIKLLKHPIASKRSKHIDVMHHFARERVAMGDVKIDYCPTSKMVADVLTKALPKTSHESHRANMGLVAY